MKSVSDNPTATNPRPGVGILGGTFDPIHTGHLRLGWEARTQLNLKEVRLIPCHIPAHRGRPSSSAEHRLAMTELACKDVPGFMTDDWEIRRNGPSYTVETLRYLREATTPDTALVFLMGMDSFCHFCEWDEWQEILNLAHLWVASRPQTSLPDQRSDEFDLLQALNTETPSDLMNQPAGLIHHYNTTALDISATQLRGDIARGQDPRFLLPDTVWEYICQHQLYGVSSTPTQ